MKYTVGETESGGTRACAPPPPPPLSVSLGTRRAMPHYAETFQKHFSLSNVTENQSHFHRMSSPMHLEPIGL